MKKNILFMGFKCYYIKKNDQNVMSFNR